MQKVEYISCNLCGFKKDHELYKDARFRVVICTNCSLVYLNPRMIKVGYDNYYQDEYQRDRHAITTKEEAIVRLEKKDSYGKKLKRFEFLKPYLNKSSTVLEIGAGMGTQLQVIQNETKCIVEGIEISSLGAKVANEYYKLHVRNITLDDFFNINKQKFSFIILHHVLEHFLNPTKALEIIHSFTNDKGLLYIAVPNMAHPDEPMNRFFRIPHTYYFSIITLKRILKKTGWEIVMTDVGAQEIRVIAEKTSPLRPTLEDKEGVEKIQRIVKEEEKKYATLRRVKKIVEHILPRPIAHGVRKFVIKILRKLKVITV